MEVRLWTALGASFLATLVATPLVRAGAWRLGLLDRPNERSSHQTVTPRTGGLGIVIGLLAGLLLAPADLGPPGLRALLAGGLLVAGVGLVDDRFGLPAWPRLAIQLIAASGLVWTTGGLERLPLPPPLDLALGVAGPPLTVLWVVGVVNFYNFMDGIDGLAGLQGAVTAGALTLAFAPGAPSAAALAAALAGACAGFLVYNWAPASVFLGDTGSGLLGYTLAGLALVAPPGRSHEAAMVVMASLWLFLADAGICLGRRVVAGSRWHAAHREHLYQRWVAAGASHARVSSSIGFGALALTVLALVGWRTGEVFWYWTSLGAGSLMIAAEWAAVRHLERRSAGH